jgi:copper chaperone CopZ
MIYLGTVVVMSVLLGLGFDSLLRDLEPPGESHVHGVDWLATGSALLLSGLIAYLTARRIRARLGRRRAAQSQDTGLVLKVDGMSCQHCVASVKSALEGFDAVAEATPDLSSGLVRVRGEHLDASALVQAIEKAGFHASRPPEA